MLNWFMFRGRLNSNGVHTQKGNGDWPTRKFFRLDQLAPEKCSIDCQVLETERKLFAKLDDLDPMDEVAVEGRMRTSNWRDPQTGKYRDRTLATITRMEVFYYHGDKDGHSMEFMDEVGEA